MKTKPIVLAALIITVVLALPWTSLSDPSDRAEPAVPPVHIVLDPPASQTRPARDSASTVASEWETIKTEYFEDDFPNDWDLRGNPTWDRERDSDPAYPELTQWTGWCAGGGSLARTPGTLPGGAYASNMNAWMIYGPFSLRGCSGGRVEFDYWLWSEYPNDWLLWSASTDGVNFYNLGATGDYRHWRSEIFSLFDVPTLGNLGGKRRVWISFAFVSDGDDEHKGAYIDNIEVRRLRSYSPVNVYVSPKTYFANAGEWHFFETAWRDVEGCEDLKQCYVHFGATPTLANNVTLLYNAQSSKVWLRNDAGTAWLGGVQIGTPGLIENSQAIVDPGSMHRYCGDLGFVTETVTWRIQFKPAFAGFKKVGMKAIDKWGTRAPGQWMGDWAIIP